MRFKIDNEIRSEVRTDLLICELLVVFYKANMYLYLSVKDKEACIPIACFQEDF